MIYIYIYILSYEYVLKLQYTCTHTVLYGYIVYKSCTSYSTPVLIIQMYYSTLVQYYSYNNVFL